MDLLIPAANAIFIVSEVLQIMIIVRAFLTFLPRIDPYHPVVRFLDQVVSPILRPFQALMPPMGGFDLSPILALFTIQIVAKLLVSLLRGLAL
ncbi:MAG: YggT family protein [Candidatus Sericytochromatia bacterium]|nr:YggT family protein [Candidatus Sericytochromatia bacterium]